MKLLFIVLIFVASGCSMPPAASPSPVAAHPNVLLILVDDLGYSDIQPFGGEIPTPTLSQLAAEGLRFSNFHTAMKCNPSRAMLMTGRDNNFGASGPRTNYQLRADVPTLAERLRDGGYHTYIAGKWDNGSDPGERPFDRGFESSFVLLPGAGLHYRAHDGNDVRDDGTTVGYSANGQNTNISGDFYSTTSYTQTLLRFIEANRGDGRPFFAYAAYTAPHYPLQAPADEIAKFEGVYDAGYAAIHEARVTRLRALGLLQENTPVWQDPELPVWADMSAEDRAYEARRMQVFAAMVAGLDAAVAELLAYLDKHGLRDNTLVIFASDNGADGTVRGAGFRPDAHDNHIDNLGSASSFVTQGLNWAKVSSTPLRLVKAFPTEGGTRAPMIVRWPGQIDAGRTTHEWLRISDLAPTILQLAGLPWERDPKDTTIGRSALDLLRDGTPIYADNEPRIHTYIERRLGGANVLQDNHKLVWWKTRGEYIRPMLFDIDADPTETTDLAAKYPEKVAELTTAWRDYAARVGDEIIEADPPSGNSQ